jgi:hypothetical protein
MSKDWRHFTTTFLVLMFVVFLFNRFLLWNEFRDGIVFNDPLFNYFDARDYSVVIVLLLYASVGFFLFYNIKKPLLLSRFVWSYIFILLMRMVALFFLPLYCDPDAVKLEDPVLNNLIYPNNYVERDLFFSGHATMMVSFYWCFTNHTIKRVYLVGAVVVSTLLVLQKIHFTIDVLAAPLFSFISIWLADWVMKKTSNEFKLNTV